MMQDFAGAFSTNFRVITMVITEKGNLSHVEPTGSIAFSTWVVDCYSYQEGHTGWLKI